MSKTRVERPLITCTTAALKQKAKESMDDPQDLVDLFFELQFRKRKAALELREYVRQLLNSLNQPFRWPETDVSPGNEGLPHGVFEIDTGLLSTMGYRVGLAGVGVARRRDILDDIYEQELPILRGHPQKRQWGKPKSSTRLRKLANVLASMVCLRKRMQNPPKMAISEWEADLRYLKKKFFLGTYDFDWPSTVNR
jgi:hypothetical protein